MTQQEQERRWICDVNGDDGDHRTMEVQNNDQGAAEEESKNTNASQQKDSAIRLW